MDAKQLTETITDGGILSTNFFNGRLLSGEDLTREQEANRGARRRLGQAIGAGIAYGLEVAKPEGVDTRLTPMVRVEAGMAVNGRGETLVLKQPTQVSLVRLPETDTATMATTEPFNDCVPPQAGVYVADAGIYLLVISPAAGRAGRAPVSGLGNTTAGCNARYTVEGVQFRLIQLPLSAQELSNANAPHLRNQVAYQCFGYDAVRALVTDPFGTQPAGYGAIDDLPASRLGVCDVPLALLHWTTAGGIDFVDLWSVRRRLVRRSSTGEWALFAADRRAREGEAMFMQFQEHVSALRGSVGSPQLLVATDYFSYLPAAGIIPIADGGHAQGFNHLSFFNGLTYRKPVFIEGAKVEALLREARTYAPIDMKSGELIWLYLVRENRQAVAAGGPRQPTPYMIFTSGHLPFQGDARFNLSRWDYSNYSSTAFYGA